MDDEELIAGEESCPICRRRNVPGACDSCEHFIGVVWDGELIWGQFDDAPGERFNAAWSSLQEVWSEVSERPNVRLRELQRLCRAAGVESLWLSTEESAAKVLEKLNSFEKGPDLETDGMLSGCGHSLYHVDPKIVVTLAARMEQLRQRLSEAPA
ncbi:MAG TPA: hypothetical protein PKX00_18465 [Opitutaceae bacterium]|nr:hypothetical protein [Opitutaceae bacterium]